MDALELTYALLVCFVDGIQGILDGNAFQVACRDLHA